jgi:hypothetical protein
MFSPFHQKDIIVNNRHSSSDEISVLTPSFPASTNKSSLTTASKDGSMKKRVPTPSTTETAIDALMLLGLPEEEVTNNLKKRSTLVSLGVTHFEDCNTNTKKTKKQKNTTTVKPSANRFTDVKLPFFWDHLNLASEDINASHLQNFVSTTISLIDKGQEKDLEVTTGYKVTRFLWNSIPVEERKKIPLLHGFAGNNLKDDSHDEVSDDEMDLNLFVVVNINKLFNTTHWRVLGKVLHITRYGSRNKDDIRNAIAYASSERGRILSAVNKANQVALLKTNTIIRLIQACLHQDVVCQLVKINDLKGREDYEKYKLPSEYYSNVHALYSDRESDDSLCLLSFLEDVHIGAALGQLNVRNFEPLDQREIKIKFDALIRVRKYVLRNMTCSGTHNSDPWDFLDSALANVPGIGKMESYYFVKRCTHIVDMDSAFRPFLSDEVKGGSNTSSESMLASSVSSSNVRETKSKKQGNEIAKKMDEFNHLFAKEMERRNDMLEKKLKEDSTTDKQNRLLAALKTANDLSIDGMSRKVARKIAEKLMVDLGIDQNDSDYDE